MDYQEKKVVGLWRVVVEWGSYEGREEKIYCVQASSVMEAWELFCTYWEKMNEHGVYEVDSTLLCWGSSAPYTFFIPSTETLRTMNMECCENEAEAEYEITRKIQMIQDGKYGECDWHRSTVARKVTIEPQVIISSL